tara:strand:+ start:113 stop:340 length:228 start_codon:yes stop_codon:yes gene_type:complete
MKGEWKNLPMIMTKLNLSVMNNSKINMTAVMNVAGLEKKKELEELMEHDDYSESLRQELTHIYLINNLMLITAKN